MNLWLLGGQDGGRNRQGVWDGHVRTDIFKMNNQQGHIVWHMGLCSMLCGNLSGRGIWGRMDTCVCMTESICYSLETITTITSYTQIQSKKVFKKRISGHIFKPSFNFSKQCFVIFNIQVFLAYLLSDVFPNISHFCAIVNDTV